MVATSKETNSEVTTINPATNQPIKTYPFLDAKTLSASLNKAAHGFKLWRDTPPAERAKFLSRLAAELRANSEEYAKLLTQEICGRGHHARTD